MTHGFASQQLPRSNRIGSRRFRRRLVIGTYGGWLLIAVIARLISLPFPGWVSVFAVVPVLLIVNATVWLIWLNRRTYINREVLVGDAGLDERLVQNRNHAFRIAFQVFSLTVLMAWPLSWVAIGLQPDNQGYINAFVIYSGASLLATTLPTAIWAWREPDPLP
jgi:hypothetical protein